MDVQVRYRSVDVWRWRGRSVDVSVPRCNCTKAREKKERKKERHERKKERTKERKTGDRCQGATVWMYRCDIDVQMCGCGEVER